MKISNNKGTTLIELMIYVALFCVIILLVFKQYKGFLDGFNSQQQVTQMQLDARNALNVIVNEIRNTGCKTYLTRNNGKIIKNTDQYAYISDSSSFVHKQGNPSDTLTIYKTAYSATGARDSTDSITYYLNKDSTTLVRKWNNKSLEFKKNFYALQFQYGIYKSDSMIYDLDPLVMPSNWSISNSSGTPPTRTTTTSHAIFEFTGPATGYVYYSTTFALSAKMKLKVKMNLETNQGFPSNLDSIKCEILQNSIVKGSEKFTPTNMCQEIVFVSDVASPAMIAFKYWVKGTGKLIVGGVEIQQNDLGTYVWSNNPPANKKKHVQAIKILMLARTKYDKSGSLETMPIQIADVSYTPSGKYCWRSLEEIVEVFNNGNF